MVQLWTSRVTSKGVYGPNYLATYVTFGYLISWWVSCYQSRWKLYEPSRFGMQCPCWSFHLLLWQRRCLGNQFSQAYGTTAAYDGSVCRISPKSAKPLPIHVRC